MLILPHIFKKMCLLINVVNKNFHIDIIQSRNLTKVAGNSVIQYQPTDGPIDLSLKHYIVIEKV